MPETTIQQERAALATATRLHLEAAEGVDHNLIDGAEDAHYLPPELEPQWIIAYKLNVDDEGEYGIPHPVPQGELTGGSRLLALRRLDGGRAWTLTQPDRVAPQGTIECVSERCGDAHMGGRRKMLRTLDQLIAHVETFHPDDFRTYKKYFDQIADQLALANPRLMRLMGMAGLSGADAITQDAAAYYCPDDECAESFPTKAKLDKHMKQHKEGA